MSSRTNSFRAQMSVRILVLLACTTLAAGCAGGPKLSLSRARWPESMKFANMRQSFTGLVKRKDKTDKKTDKQIAEQQESGKARVDALSQDRSLAIKRAFGSLPASDNTRSKSRILPILSRSQHARKALPEDPFLASLDSVEPGAEKTSVIAERTVDTETPFADDNPFTLVAKARQSHSDTKRPLADSMPTANTFVDGFDSKWEQLRGTNDDHDTSLFDRKLADTLPVDPDLVRQAITGSTDEQITDIASSPADSETSVPPLPDWAQQPTYQPQDPVAFDRQNLRDDRAEPSPAAMVIVPAGRNNSWDSPPRIPLDEKASGRVELLPSPTEAGNDRTDMIVESETLAPGFAEWRGDGENAVVRTNSPIRETSTGSTAGGFGWGQSHSNLSASLSSAATDHANADDDTFADIGSQYEGPAVLTDTEPRPIKNVLPAGPIKKAKSAVPDVAGLGQIADIEPRLFLFSDDSAAAEESSLETVNWDPELEPGASQGSPIIGSKAVLGLLIGLACLAGFVVFRRRHATI